jgi:hypothetical protein
MSEEVEQKEAKKIETRAPHATECSPLHAGTFHDGELP